MPGKKSTPDKKVFPPPKEFSKNAHVKNKKQYEEMYQRSIDDPEGFWAEMAADNIHWFKKWKKVVQRDLKKPEVKWFTGGTLNVSYNCLDRHLTTHRKNKEKSQRAGCAPRQPRNRAAEDNLVPEGGYIVR